MAGQVRWLDDQPDTTSAPAARPAPSLGLPSQTAAPTASTPTPGVRWLSDEAPVDYGGSDVEPAPSVGLPQSKSSLGDSTIRGIGQVMGRARAFRDLGVPGAGAVEDYGLKLQAEHPASITNLQEAAADPGQLVKETGGELAPQVAASTADATLGRWVGGGLGAVLGSAIGPEGTVGGAVVGQELGAKAFQFGGSFLTEYGGIREQQDQDKTQDLLGAAGGAGAAAALDLWSPSAALERRLALKGVRNAGKQVTKKGIIQAGKTVALKSGEEALNEFGQTVAERIGAHQSLTDADAGTDYGMSALKGAVGGGAVGGVEHVVSKPKSSFDPERQTGNDHTDVRPASPEGTPEGPAVQALHDLDTVLDGGIAPTETGGRSRQVSRKGAVGKYQLLPSTAKQIAERLGMPTDDIENRLLNDDDYNRTIAKAYLEQLRQHYNGDMLLAVTAYHAGQGNVDRWKTHYGYDPANPNAFLDAIGERNPESGRYARTVMRHLGGDLTTVAEVGEGGEPAEVEPDQTRTAMETASLDLSPDALIHHLRANAPDEAKALPSTVALAKAIATSDVHANDAIQAERETLNQKLQKLIDQDEAIGDGGGMGEGQAATAKIRVRKQLAVLKAREDVLDLAQQTARRAARQRAGLPELETQPGVAGATAVLDAAGAAVPAPVQPGVNLITEPADPNAGYPVGRRAPLPVEVANPGSAAPPTVRAADTVLAEREQRLAAEDAASTTARANILKDVLTDKTTHSPKERFQARLKRAGLSPVLTAQEEHDVQAHKLLQLSRGINPMAAMAEEALAAPQAGPLKPEEAAADRARQERLAAAAQEQAALPQQDTTLGVRERPAAKVDTGVVEEAPAREPTMAENIGARVEAHAAQLREANPRQSAWFTKGAQSAMGDGTVEAPTGKNQLTWFGQGQEFVATERAHQEREAGRAAGREARPERRLAKRRARDEAIAASKARQATRPATAKPALPEGPRPPTREEGIAAGLKARGERRAEAAAAKKARRAERAPPAAKKAISAKKTTAKAPGRPAAAVKAAPVAKAPAPPKAAPTATEANRAKLREAIAKRERAADLDLQEREKFLDAVDKQVGETITAQQAQQLNIATDMNENLGKETQPKFSTKELHEMLATAQAERAAAMGKGGKFALAPGSEAYNARVLGQMSATDRALRAELDRRGLHDVQLFTTTLRDLLAKHGVEAEGHFDETHIGRVISVAMDARNPLRVLNHEVVHALRSMGVIKSGDWAKLVAMARTDRLRMEHIESTYAHLSEADRMEEAVAEMFADWAANPTPAANTPDSKGITGRIREFFAAIKQWATRSNFKTAEDVMRAMHDGSLAQGQQQAAGKTGGRFMQAGEKAKTASNARRWQAMMSADKEAARQKFGWHLSPTDKKWKFEIDDSRMALKLPFDQWEESPYLFGAPKVMRLGDLITHPELFAAYPQLADMKVIKESALHNFLSGSLGWYNEDSNTLALSGALKSEQQIKEIMVHEVQHAVQGIEGFARGGSPSNRALTNRTNLKAVGDHLERVQAEMAELAANPAISTHTVNEIKATTAANATVQEQVRQLQDPESETHETVKKVEVAAEAVWDAETALKDKIAEQNTAYKERADKALAERTKLDAEYKKLSEKARNAIGTPAYQTLSAQRNAVHNAMMKTYSEGGRDYDAERAEQEPLKAAIEVAGKDLKAATDELAKLGNFTSLRHHMYRLLAGETEARDTEQRLDLTADQRRATPPGTHENILPEHQITTMTISGQGAEARGAAREGKFSIRREADLPPASKTPEAVAKRETTEKAAAAVSTIAENLGKSGHIWMTGTSDIASVYSKHMPSLGKWIELNKRSHALGHEFELRLAEIKDEYEKLPHNLKGTGPGTVNDFIEDSTTRGEWGYKPGYHDNGVIDPRLKTRFDAIAKQSPEAANVIKAVFRFGYDQHNNMKAALGSSIEAQFNPAILEATDPAEIKQLEKEKQEALEMVSRLYDTRDGAPYAPKQRQGMFAVVGSSDAYRAAKKAGDTKRMDELRKDANHYIVNFRDSSAGAEALAHEFKTKFGKDGGTWFERGTDAGNAAISPKEMGLYFTRMQHAIENSVDKEGAAAKAMGRLNRDLYLLNLSEHSARKSELGRENIASKSPVTGKGLDMMKAFVTHGRASSNLISSLANNVEMQQTIGQVKAEVEAHEGKDRTDAQRAFNEVMLRYAANLGVRPGRTVDKIVRAVSAYTLLTVPMYYLQNATQTALITQPLLASKFGYGRSAAHIARAYSDFFAFTKELSPLGRVDFTKAPKDVQPLLKYLSDLDHLNAGYSNELGGWQVNGLGLAGDVWNGVDRFLRLFPQRVEVMNRTTAGIAAYRLAKERGQSDDAAMQLAATVIDQSHGDYSGFNSPTPFRKLGDFGKVALQFRKFQLISASLVVREFNRSFRGATPQERWQGRAALGFLGAHMAAVGGIVGIPGANLIGPMIAGLMKLASGDDKDWEDWRHELRDRLGAGGDDKHRNVMGDLLYKGAPYALMNLDMSDRLGMGNIFALAPYSGIDEALTSQQKFYEGAGKAMLGPAGGVVGKAINGWGYGVEQQDWTRFAESLMPAGAANVMKAARIGTKGLQAKAGETLIPAHEVDWGEELMLALGGTPRQMANQSEEASDLYDVKDHYKAIETGIRNRYVKARKAGDGRTALSLQSEWREMQASMKRDKLRPAPLSSLMKAPMTAAKRQRQVVGGIETDRATRAFVQDMTNPDDED